MVRPSSRPIALVAALALAGTAALIAVLWPDQSGDDTVTAPPPTPAAPTTAPTTAPTSTTVQPEGPDTAAAVFPFAASDVRFTDPVEATRAFVADFVGFTDPVVGRFVQGDARSGEVEVRPTADGPVTTVFVRQLGIDGSWWVLGSVAARIRPDTPRAGDAIASPVPVSGRALVLDGPVRVEIRQDGTQEPLGSCTAACTSDVRRPFTGQIAFAAPSEPYGAVLFLAHHPDDERVWEASVVRVRFAPSREDMGAAPIAPREDPTAGRWTLAPLARLLAADRHRNREEMVPMHTGRRDHNPRPTTSPPCASR